MTIDKSPEIRVGIGGWSYEPWRETFYPPKLPQKRELEYASRKLTSIEINSTYYGSQKAASFAKWRAETPDSFVFAVKGPRFATNRRVLSEAADSIERFFSSGVMELGPKLGPINWQFMATKIFDADDFEAFLKLLPKVVQGQAISHAVEVRNPSFKCAAFIELTRHHNVAIVTAGDSDFPQIADRTASFAYLRIMGTSEQEETGYSTEALDRWSRRAKAIAAGDLPSGLEMVTSDQPSSPRDVFLYVISGHKVSNPAAAMALIERL
ncbi:uncharacterized protein YecE (DUF72 family) [Rhodoligotrophos appendicifer]|uniref:DUF72 domain-containing protein n=1 Tax=Rhodoligotrophos appendicifer TaxID=987056 RepID=UPI003D173AB1